MLFEHIYLLINNVIDEERVESVLPEIMRRSGIDMWVIIAREYNEDPVINTLLRILIPSSPCYLGCIYLPTATYRAMTSLASLP